MELQLREKWLRITVAIDRPLSSPAPQLEGLEHFKTLLCDSSNACLARSNGGTEIIFVSNMTLIITNQETSLP
jgi:hypothetical protein